MKIPNGVINVLGALFLLAAAATSGQCVINTSGAGITDADSIRFNMIGSVITASQVQSGIDLWHGCGQYGSGFPSMSVGGTGTVTINIQHIAGSNPGTDSACGKSAWSRDPTGQLNGGTITIYDSTFWGNDCEPTIAETIAHEIGHGLGMADVGVSCLPDIMGPNNFQPGSRSVLGQDCADVDSLWHTPDETPPPPPGDPPEEPPQCPTSPIIFNLGRSGYELTGVEQPVRFDINGDGIPNLISWTARNEPMAFLALDLNSNGKIDSGVELFGNSTRLPSGAVADNGFQALAQYDQNRDGVVDERDPIWQSLLLWTDRNHDGVSQRTELLPIKASSIIGISLAYHESRRRDSHGNLFRYEGMVHLRNEARACYDIFFVLAR